MTIQEFKDKLVSKIAKNDNVMGIGQTGDLNAPLIAGQSDIDMFVLCTEIPTQQEREEIYLPLSNDYSECMMAVCNGGIWGYGDILFFDGIDVMPMYFTIQEMQEYLEQTLAGEHLYKEGRFYPVGRLASIEGLNVLFERDRAWSKLIDIVKARPQELFLKMYEFHIELVLDEEDLGRSVLRKEVLFYHQVVEEALDYLLQALFALNHTYFPSRKRMQQYLEHFQVKPVNCYERLLTIVEEAAHEDTIEQSVQHLRELTAEIKNLSFER
ncbi:MAG TPA: hypothetical protein VJZ01_04935 [Lachnospiraceae bacterium]|nr:hypothetical protein [Lachnospiraceae bacterium]